MARRRSARRGSRRRRRARGDHGSAARAASRCGACVPGDLDRAARGGVHQGVVADGREARACSVEDLVRGAAAAPLIVVLDGIEDPHNVGAILRTVDAAGVDGVVRQTRHAAALDGAAAKASAGAVAHVTHRGRRQHRARDRRAQGGGRLDGRARRRCREALRRDRFDGADRNGGRRGGSRAAAAGARAVRLAGVDSDERARGELERVGGRRRRVVRGRSPAPDRNRYNREFRR